MIKMNEEKLIEKLKDNIPEDYIRGCDTSDGIECYEIDTDSWQYQLYVYVSKLQNNWNELKKWLEEQIKDYRKREWFPVANNLKEVLNKMQELQGDDKN